MGKSLIHAIYRDSISSPRKKSHSYFLMHPYIITYMIDKENHEVSHRSDTYFPVHQKHLISTANL